VCIDACKEGLRGVPMQEGHVIFYESKKLNENEVNYVTHDMEFIVIMNSLKMWRHYLFGRIFLLMTNHSGLRYLFYQPKLNVRQARWMDFLSEFNFEIKHMKGKENRVVDAPSRSIKLVNLAVVKTNQSNIKERVKST
jgi:hypothetical protein